ncbi:mitotic-spindle organizing 1 [Fusarium albosuccineum]|uniref:Mitotic-spindle organizing protein 1 n=1 Tax=Fusarium albosuccineum TaxID=1237068 RepID=A0A8H4P7H8_9HYPO|nr:mitotic-spindle organizing 1 [Fusarium albosuccineum]
MPEPDKHAAAQQAVDILHEISTILNCHLDRRTLSICISMIERGVNPEALARLTTCANNWFSGGSKSSRSSGKRLNKWNNHPQQLREDADGSRRID